MFIHLHALVPTLARKLVHAQTHARQKTTLERAHTSPQVIFFSSSRVRTLLTLSCAVLTIRLSKGILVSDTIIFRVRRQALFCKSQALSLPLSENVVRFRIIIQTRGCPVSLDLTLKTEKRLTGRKTLLSVSCEIEHRDVDTLCTTQLTHTCILLQCKRDGGAPCALGLDR